MNISSTGNSFTLVKNRAGPNIKRIKDKHVYDELPGLIEYQITGILNATFLNNIVKLIICLSVYCVSL